MIAYHDEKREIKECTQKGGAAGIFGEGMIVYLMHGCYSDRLRCSLNNYNGNFVEFFMDFIPIMYDDFIVRALYGLTLLLISVSHEQKSCHTYTATGINPSCGLWLHMLFSRNYIV